MDKPVQIVETHYDSPETALLHAMSSEWRVAVSSQTTYQPGSVEPGWTTTEFYQTLIVHLVAVAVAIGTIFKPGFNLDGVQAIIPAAALAASAVAQAAYSLSRSRVKSAALDSVTAPSTGAANATAPSVPAPEGGVQPPLRGASASGAGEHLLTVTISGTGLSGANFKDAASSANWSDVAAAIQNLAAALTDVLAVGRDSPPQPISGPAVP